MAPFYGWDSTASKLQPLRGGSLLFTIQFPEIPGTHFIDLGRMKGWVDLGATQWFWARDPWIENPEATFLWKSYPENVNQKLVPDPFLILVYTSKQSLNARNYFKNKIFSKRIIKMP